MTAQQLARKNRQAQQAAYLCAVHEMKQPEIAGLLGGLSQSGVSRLLKWAEERGWLKRSYAFVPAGLSPERVVELKGFVEPSSLVARLAQVESRTGVRVRGVHVVDGGAGGTTPKALAARLGRFGRAAGVPLANLLAQSSVCAVTWGRTVSHVVDGMPAASADAPDRSIRFVPVCGEPLERASERDTSSHLAERLHQRMRSSAALPPSLTGVPALIPRRFQGADARGIRKFVREAASYREVFGTATPLIDRVDSLLTAVGPSSRPMGFIHDELLRAGSTPRKKLTAARLSELVAGDLGGVLFPRPDLDSREQTEVEALNAMWTGATLRHLERIARQAARGTRPGIIVVSMGDEERAKIIAEAVRYGLINELIIDRPLSEALTRALAA